MSETKFEPIAIIGLGTAFPGSEDTCRFWHSIINGVDQITEVPPTHWLISDYYDPDPKAPNKTYCKWGAFLAPMAFNPIEFGIPPANVPQTDSTQLLGLLVAKQLLQDAFGSQFDKTVDLSRTSVILGITSGQELCSYAAGRLQYPIWKQALRKAGIPQDIEERICEEVSESYIPWSENMFPGLLGNVVSGRIANRFNLGGTNCVIDAACASSLAAIAMAIDELHLGRTDLVIAGGADTFNDIFMYMCFSKTPALSASGACRPFAKAADGTLLGEGLGFMALKRLTDAERDNNKIYAVIRGLGSSSDGRSKSIYAPAAEGQAVAIGRSYAAAGFDPHTIELIEAHGTGTAAGDAAEMKGLKLAFAKAEGKKPWCAVGSIKSQIGHTKAAAGSAALIKAILALRHKTLPPTIKVDAPNPALGIEDSPFYLNTQTRPWVRSSEHPRRAGVSAFGFGGTNFHIALEEYQGPGKLAPRLRALPTELVLLSATSTQGLLELIQQTQNQAQAKGALPYIAKRSQQQFSPQHPVRLAIIASDELDLLTKLRAFAQQVAQNTAPAHLPANVHYAHHQAVGKIALLFPGQGSQYVNMGADLLMAFDAAQSIWSQIDAIPLDTTKRLHEVVFPPPVFGAEQAQAQQKQLAMTEWTQPALAATSIMQLALLQAAGIKADCYAGHSFGELIALYAAGAFDAKILMQVARKRGELMAEAGATIPGAMTAVMCADMPGLLQNIVEWNIAVTPANFNSPEQTVFSGSLAAIAALEAKLSAAKISFRRLAVSTAFHSQIIKDSQQPFLDYLRTLTFSSPRQTVYANTTAAAYPEEPEQIKDYLARQLLHPVRFVEQIDAMYKAGVRTFIEVGPQGILTNFVKKILTGKDFSVISIDNKQNNGITSFWNALGELAVNGIPLNLMAFWQDYMEPVKPAPTAEKSFALNISGTSYGKLYPPPGGAETLSKPNPPGFIPDWIKDENTHSLPINERIEPMLLNNNKPLANGLADGEPHESQADNHTIDKILDLYQKLQEEVTKAHVEYQTLTEKSHVAFLEEARVALDDIRQLALGMEPTHHYPAKNQDVTIAATASSPPAVDANPPLAKTETPPTVAPAQRMQPPPVVMITTPSPATAVASQAQPAIALVTQPIVPDQVSTDIDPELQATILAIVADKTGYPEETLNMDMDLEADIGIDSIKRVEIFSAMQEKMPNLPELDLAELGGLHTFREIAAYVKKQQGV